MEQTLELFSDNKIEGEYNKLKEGEVRGQNHEISIILALNCLF